MSPVLLASPAAVESRPPDTRPRLVDRPRLTSLVERVSEVKLVVVRAPAGYGKTSLLLQWFHELEARGRSPRWLSLDPADDDPSRLVGRLAAALGSAPGEPAAPAAGAVRPADLLPLVERLASGPPFVLFLDELESLRSAAAPAMVARLVESMPAGSCVVLASRQAPAFELGALRVRDALLEVDFEDLRFTEAEAESMMRSRAIPVDAASVADVLARTEGWAAGLQLVALAVGKRKDASAFVRSLAGSRRDVAEFLAEQVFLHEPEEVRDFLLRTSILERLTAPLCDAVTGRGDGERRLEELERRGLFLSAADEERSAYRYHALFSEFLRDRLRREAPESVAGLHAVAARWHAEHGPAHRAVEHAFAAGDLGLAADLVERWAKATFLQGHFATLVGWVERLPAELLDAHPAVHEAAAWTYACRRSPQEARRHVEALRRLQARRRLAPTELDALAAVEAINLVFEDRGPEAYEEAQRSLPDLSGEDPFASAALQHALALGQIATGAYEEARSMLVLARANLERAGSLFGSVYSVSLMGLCEAVQGRLWAARGVYEEARSLTSLADQESTQTAMVPLVYLAEVLYEHDELDEAEVHLETAFRHLAGGAIGDMVACAHLTRARLRVARGDTDGAMRALEEAERHGLDTGFTRLSALARWERVRVALHRGDLAEARGYRAQAIRMTAGGEPPGHFHHASETEARDLGDVRFQIRAGEPRSALSRIRPLLAKSDEARRGWRSLRLKILEAEALDAAGDRPAALRALHEALRRGAPQGFVRSFADEGPPLAALLRAHAEHSAAEEATAGDVPAEWLSRVLAASGASAGGPALAGEALDEPIEALSSRELEILARLAEGLSNRELARRLFVSEHTVKWHLLKIFGKLRVHSRVRAVAVARYRGLVP